MYIEEIDFTTLADQDDIDVVTSSNASKRERALKMAMDEVRSYMRVRYRINLEFAKTGDARNNYIVLILIDLTLYHLYSMLAPRMGLETKKERYDAAIAWLKDVRDGKSDPGIPSIDDPEEGGTDPSQNPEMYDTIRFGNTDNKSMY
jgi:phage gp36-like protein